MVGATWPASRLRRCTSSCEKRCSVSVWTESEPTGMSLAMRGTATTLRAPRRAAQSWGLAQAW
jgi:hypothetical protein